MTDMQEIRWVMPVDDENEADMMTFGKVSVW